MLTGHSNAEESGLYPALTVVNEEDKPAWPAARRAVPNSYLSDANSVKIRSCKAWLPDCNSRFEQWLMRSLVDPESLYSRMRSQMTTTADDFEKIPE